MSRLSSSVDKSAFILLLGTAFLACSESCFRDIACPFPVVVQENGGRVFWKYPGQVSEPGRTDKYISATAFSNGEAIVSDSTGCYIVDRQFMDLCEGKRYSKIRKVTNAVYWFWSMDGKSLGPGKSWSNLEALSESVSPFVYPDFGVGDLIPCKNDSTGLLGYFSINENSFIAVDGVDVVQEFHDGFALVGRTEGGQRIWSFIDNPKEGMGDQRLGGMEFDAASHFSEGRAAIKLIGRDGWCFLDTAGGIEQIKGLDGIEYVFPISEGLAGVKVGGKFGYVNRSGRLALPAIYSSASSFSFGAASVSVDETHFGYIDCLGGVIGGFKFSSGGPCVGGYANVSVVSLVNDSGLRRSPRMDEWRVYCLFDGVFIDQ